LAKAPFYNEINVKKMILTFSSRPIIKDFSGALISEIAAFAALVRSLESTGSEPDGSTAYGIVI
jgi:hypothetical protein